MKMTKTTVARRKRERERSPKETRTRPMPRGKGEAAPPVRGLVRPGPPRICPMPRRLPRPPKQKRLRSERLWSTESLILMQVRSLKSSYTPIAGQWSKGVMGVAVVI